MQQHAKQDHADTDYIGMLFQYAQELFHYVAPHSANRVRNAVK